MADTVHDPQLRAQDLRDHRETFSAFGRLVFFSILHITLVLACLALAFLGNVPVLALMLGVGGTVALLVVFTVFG